MFNPHFLKQHMQWIVGSIAGVIAVIGTLISLHFGWILAYGDAESHINIAKKVVGSLTPGFAQLGGIWLPLTHILMIPFVFFDPLWRTGLAGSIVSGIFFIAACVYIYKTALLLTRNMLASFITFLVFALNLNIVYMQSTPMTEVPLIALFILSSYYFIKYLLNQNALPSLLLAALFAFAASLTRYDGWFLVFFEAICIIGPYLRNKTLFKEKTGDVILFLTLAGFGILCWFGWCYLILGDPLYFMDSMYSARAQQLSWLAKGELPAYHNLFLSIVYYTYTALANIGLPIFIVSSIGLLVFFFDKTVQKKFWIVVVLLVPFIFNVVSLFLGQDVIFIPGLTPAHFEWHLFNVRYGIQMVPTAAIFFGYLFAKMKIQGKLTLSLLFLLEFGLIAIGYENVITLADGTHGLSAAIIPTNVENFINTHYHGGLVLIDDYARTISITRSTIPMQDIIYVGNKPYWDISLKHPETYATWIIMQKNDAVWKAIYDNAAVRGDMYKYFKKVYTSNQILIFEKN